jgi:hypothetical protein
MSTLERLDDWKQRGIITATQCETLSALVRKDRFSLFLELNALLYIGVLSLAGGIGWTVQTYATNLRNVFILAALTAICASSLLYCMVRGPAYSRLEVESPNLGFDYVLYLGCMVFAAELGYIEYRFSLLRDKWDVYLLLSSLVFFVLSYRFDNRFVLSLSLSSLAGWFGVRLNRLGLVYNDSLRLAGWAYSGIVMIAGTWLSRLGIKKHFQDTYIHIAANVFFLATLSGVGPDPNAIVYLAVLVLAAVVSIALGFRNRQFAFVVYGTVYGYVGISQQILQSMHESTSVFAYFAITGSIVVLSIAAMSRRFGKEE